MRTWLDFRHVVMHIKGEMDILGIKGTQQKLQMILKTSMVKSEN